MQWVRIFDGQAQAAQILQDDEPKLLVVHGKRICLVMRGDTFYAVQDKCTHNGDSLSKGKVNYLGEVICPWHNYRFDLQSGRESSTRSADLITYPLKIDEAGFFVGIF